MPGIDVESIDMALLPFLILTTVLHTASGASTEARVYYVVADNGTSCPFMENVTCESLEYYMNDTEQYFTSNTTFYFMEAIHFIGHYQSLLIHQVSNLTLVGHQEVHHDTQPKAVIKCASPTSNILITFSNHITVMNLTITNCGRRWHLSSLLSLQYYSYLYSRGSRISSFALFNITLGFIETINVTLQNVSVLDNFGFGLCTVNTFELVINKSLFLRNNYKAMSQGCTDLCYGGNIAILFTDKISFCSQNAIIYNVSITNTNITYGREGLHNSDIGAGLYIFMEQVSVYGVRIMVNKVHAYNNSGNIAVVTTTQVTHYEINIDNLVSGYTETLGGGFYMLTYDVSIKYVHCGYGWLYERNPLRLINSEFFLNTNVSIMFKFGALDQSQAINEVQLENVTISYSYDEEILVSGRNTQTKFLFKNIIIRDHTFLPLGNNLAVVLVFSADNVTFEDIIIENSRVTALFAINSNIYVKGVKNLFKNNTGLLGGAIALYSSSVLFIMEDTLLIKNDVGIESVVCGYNWANEKDLLRIINSDFVSNLDTSIVFNYGLLGHRHAIDEVWIENVTISHSSNEEILVYGRDVETKFFMKNLTIRDHTLLPIDNTLAVVSVFSVNNVTFEDININNSLITPLFAVDSNVYMKGVNFF